MYIAAVNSYKNNQSTSFKGFRTKDAKALVALDLDGTLAKGNTDEIQRVFELAKKADATVVYATGRTIEGFHNLQRSLAAKGVILPSVKNIITDNGQAVYENIEGKYIKDDNWHKTIKRKTRFDKAQVYDAMQELGQRSSYLMDKNTQKEMRNSPDFERRKQLDKGFYNSQISYYEFYPSEMSLEYALGPKVNIKKLEKDVRKSLKDKNIKTKFTYYLFVKEKFNGVTDETLLLKTFPYRVNKKEESKALYLAPCNKASGIEYLRQKFGIDKNEVLTAGDERNDHCVAKLAKKGAFFICVANATEDFRKIVEKMKIKSVYSDNLILSQKQGAAGIADGMMQVLQKFRPDINL